MAFNLRNRSFVKEVDFTPKEWKFLLDLAAELKASKYAGSERPRLTGKNIALIFEKTSTRTRCAASMASGSVTSGCCLARASSSGTRRGRGGVMSDQPVLRPRRRAVTAAGPPPQRPGAQAPAVVGSVGRVSWSAVMAGP